jgi:hypothetical protein
MTATLINLAQIQAMPNGLFLVQALQRIVDAINTAPVKVAGRSISTGTGTPENRVSGSIGDLYLRDDGSTSTTLYVKTSGTATTAGWTAK